MLSSRGNLLPVVSRGWVEVEASGPQAAGPAGPAGIALSDPKLSRLDLWPQRFWCCHPEGRSPESDVSVFWTLLVRL